MSGNVDYLLEGDPREALAWHVREDVRGNPVTADRCTLAHLTATDDAAVARFGFGVEILQDAFNTGVALSAGTHDFGRVLDVFIPQVDWLVQQRFFRAQGWAAWYRKPPQFSSHIHMISLPVVDTFVRVGEFVPGQVDDYLANPPRNGLAGHALDLTWHPDPIARFDYQQWKQVNMQLDPAQITEIADKAVAKLLATELTLSDGSIVDIKQALRRAAQVPDQVDEVIDHVAIVGADVAKVKTKVDNSRLAIMTKLASLDEQVS